MKLESKHVILFLAIAILMVAAVIGVANVRRAGVSSLGEYDGADTYIDNVKLEEGDGNVVITPNDAHNGLELSLESPLTGVLIGSGDRLNVGTELNFEQSDGTGLYYSTELISAYSVSPGASGPTLTASTASTLGGYQLTAVGHILYFHTHISDDWDGATDMLVDVTFEKNTAGGSGGDTVDLQLVCYYKGDGEAASKTQVVEVPVTVDDAAQFTRFSATFTIDWDKVDNVVEAEDCISFQLNLETDTSEVDDVIINHFLIKYETKKPAVEVP